MHLQSETLCPELAKTNTNIYPQLKKTYSLPKKPKILISQKSIDFYHNSIDMNTIPYPRSKTFRPELMKANKIMESIADTFPDIISPITPSDELFINKFFESEKHDTYGNSWNYVAQKQNGI